jgi:hypothetical protein
MNIPLHSIAKIAAQAQSRLESQAFQGQPINLGQRPLAPHYAQGARHHVEQGIRVSSQAYQKYGSSIALFSRTTMPCAYLHSQFISHSTWVCSLSCTYFLPFPHFWSCLPGTVHSAICISIKLLYPLQAQACCPWFQTILICDCTAAIFPNSFQFVDWEDQLAVAQWSSPFKVQFNVNPDPRYQLYRIALHAYQSNHTLQSGTSVYLENKDYNLTIRGDKTTTFAN